VIESGGRCPRDLVPGEPTRELAYVTHGRYVARNGDVRMRSSEDESAPITDDTRLEPNEAEVAAKAYDDEVIFMHLGTGVYASIEQLGAIVWEAINQRYSVGEIAEALRTSYEVAPAQALDDARALAAQLLDEQLVRRSGDSERRGAVTLTGARGPYVTPSLVIYRDMEDLLALDPPLPQYAEAPWRKA
jgi:hypothetical protein